MFSHIYVLFELGAIVLVLGIAVWGFIFWDRRYRGAPGPAERFQPTEETFRDPTTGRMMRVFFNPDTGERQYRESLTP
jgi:hypothetical protein